MGKHADKAGNIEVIAGRAGIVVQDVPRVLKPAKKRWLTVVAIVLVTAGAVGFGLLAQQVFERVRHPKPTASGLPKQLNDIQNLRISKDPSDQKKAAEEIAQALSDPKTSAVTKKELYMQKAYAAMDAGDLKGAIDDYKQAVAINPDPNVYELIGQAYFQLGDKTSARAAYAKGLELIGTDTHQNGLKNDLQQRIDIIDGKLDPTKQ